MRTRINFISVLVMLAMVLVPMSPKRAAELHKAPIPTEVSTTCQGQTFPCDASLSITNVEYLGKVVTHDDIKVSGVFSSTSPCFSLSSSPQLNFNALPQADLSLSVKVTRKLGHEDTGFGSLSRAIGPFSTTVKVPRGTLETDPQSINVKVDLVATLNSSAGARVTGNGIPALTSGPVSSPIPSGNTAQCKPTVTITGLNYVQGSGTQPDNVIVNWTVTPPQASCLKLTNVTASVKLTRTDGSVGTGTSGGSGTATIQVSGSPGNVALFEVRVDAPANSTQITATTQKNVNP